MQKVVGLDQGVVQLDERKAAVLEAFPVRAVLHQLVDGEVAANIAQELDPLQAKQPIGVVDHQRTITRKIQIAAEMLTDAGQVAVDLFDGQHRPLGGAIGWVTNHARAAADDGDRPMPELLRVGQRHDAHQVPGVQAGGGRVETLVERDGAAVKGTPQGVLVGDLGDEAAGAQNVEDVGPGGGRHG